MNMKPSDKALAYRQMLEMTAWKEFQAFMNEIKQTAINKIIASDDLKEIHLNRGIIQCINSIESNLDYETK